MTLAEEFVEWVAAIGAASHEEGQKASEEWLEEYLGREWDDDAKEEYLQLMFTVIDHAMMTAIAEGNLLNMAQSVFYTTFRFATWREAKKVLPDV